MQFRPVVFRPRIEQLLVAAWQRRVTLVVADAGYGKTTALRQLAADDRARWLGLRTGDREVETLATRIDEALGAASRHTRAAERAAIGAADRRSLAEGRAALVCERLDSEKGELLLILDDVDQLEDDDSAAQFLTTLCLQAPSRLHILLSGRRLPMLGLGSARGRGELMELTARDLAFSREETSSLLVDRLGPDAGVLSAECWSLTAGWAAALQLIADRLERVSPSRWREAIEQLRQRRGTVWREFAADLAAREEQPAGRILAIASIAPTVEADLLAALGIAAAEPELDRLETRGLLVSSGELGSRALSPVLAEAVRDRLSAAETEALRRQTSAWFEQGDRLEEALECVTPGPRGEVQALLQRCGERLIGQAGGLRVAEVIRGLGAAEDLALDTLLAQALVAAGDWDGAMEVFATIRRNAGVGPLAATVAWRLGALLYLRSEFEPAEEVPSAAYSDDGGTRDDALVAAWLAATLWGRGKAEQGERVASVALRHAEASGDAAARAAAHVSMALAAASQGDRERNERHYGSH